MNPGPTGKRIVNARDLSAKFGRSTLSREAANGGPKRAGGYRRMLNGFIKLSWPV